MRPFCWTSRSFAAASWVVVQGVRVRDPELGLRLHQVEGGVGDVDRVVVGRDLALVRRGRIEHDAPAVGLRRDDRRVVHQDVRAAAVGHAVADAVDRVVGLVLQAVEHVLVVRDQVEVDRGDVAAGDQAERRVTRRRHAVVLAGLHQLDHVGRVDADLDRDLAAGRLLERGDPVVALDLLAAGPADDVAGPGDEVQLALGRTERRRRSARDADRRSPRAGSGGRAGGRLARRGALAAGLLGDGVAPLLHAPTTTAAAAIAVRILRCCIGVLLRSAPPPRGADQPPASATG